jgi:hypothetical protein
MPSFRSFFLHAAIGEMIERATASPTPENDIASNDARVAMELSALTQFISNVAMALDASCDVPPDEMATHLERGDTIELLTDLCSADVGLMTKLFRDHWTTPTERELASMLRNASIDNRLKGNFHRSGLCYLIALTAGLIERGTFKL